MNPLQAFDTLNAKLDEFGLSQLGWKAEADRAKRRHGRCSYVKRTIFLSWPLTLENPIEIVNDTILHEIAHALVGPGYGHGFIWKCKAIEVGARPIRCAVGGVQLEGKYQFLCGCPNKVFHYHRRLKNQKYCRRCGQNLYLPGTYSPLPKFKILTFPSIQDIVAKVG